MICPKTAIHLVSRLQPAGSDPVLYFPPTASLLSADIENISAIDASNMRNHSILTIGNLLLGDLSHTVDVRNISGSHSLGHLDAPRNGVPVGDGIRGRDGRDLDNRNPGVWRTRSTHCRDGYATARLTFGASVMFAVAKIADPGFESGRVMLADRLTVVDDLGGAADGSPLTRWVQERDIDVRIGLQLVRLPRLGVGVEDEVDVVFLLRVVRCVAQTMDIHEARAKLLAGRSNERGEHLTFPAKAMHRLTK